MSDPLESLVTRLLELSTRDETGARRLPPERDLGAALDISRGALREQLSQLENLGVLRRRQGHGSYIDAPDVGFIRTYFTLMRRLEYLSNDQFTQAREMLEETIAAAAALSVTTTDVAELREIVGTMISRTAAGDHAGALEADISFHDRLYSIIDNPIFTMLNEGFRHVLRDNIRLRRELANTVEAPNENGEMNTDAVHHRIVDALEHHDPDEAREAMRKHFADYSLLALTRTDRVTAPDTTPGEQQ